VIAISAPPYYVVGVDKTRGTDRQSEKVRSSRVSWYITTYGAKTHDRPGAPYK